MHRLLSLVKEKNSMLDKKTSLWDWNPLLSLEEKCFQFPLNITQMLPVFLI